MGEALRIGWHEVDITPEQPIELCGQYYQRLSRGVHSRLKAVVWAVEQGGQAAVMVCVDLAGINRAFQDELRERLRGRLSVDPGNVIVNATHTHCGPSIAAFSDMWSPAPEAIDPDTYRSFLLDRLEEAVLEAWGDRSKGGVSHACGHASVGHCRRVVYTDGVAEMYGDTTRPDFAGMEGGEDASFDVLFCFDENGKPTGAVVNIPCPSQVMEATYKVSSDYMGRLRELTQERFGESFRTLCQVAPAGDQSPRDLTRPGTTVPLWGPEGVEILANRLMRAIDAVYPDVERTIDYDAALSHAVSSLALPRRRASYQEYRAASETVDRLEAIQSLQDAYADFCEETHATETILNRPGPYDNKLCHFGEVMNNKAVIARYEDQDEQPNYEFELHVLRVGNVVFATNPFELFLEYGQRIRARSRAAGTFLVQLCGDCGGYLPTPRAEQLGGYGGLIVNGRVGPDGGALLVDATVDRINAIVSTDEGKA